MNGFTKIDAFSGQENTSFHGTEIFRAPSHFEVHAGACPGGPRGPNTFVAQNISPYEHLSNARKSHLKDRNLEFRLALRAL